MNINIEESPSFNIEIQPISMMVRYKTIGDRNVIIQLYHYYMACIGSYWEKYQQKSSIYPRGNIYDKSDVEQQFNQALIDIENTYQFVLENKDQRYDLIKVIIDLFENFTRWICNSRSTYMNRYSDKVDVYPLTNETGMFGYNSYMYALVNDIIIVGIPSGESSYDNVHGCADLFLTHDYAHNVSMMRFFRSNSDIKWSFKEVYELIHASQMTPLERETCIFTVFFLVHEMFYTLYPFDLNKIDKVFNNYDRAIPQYVDFGVSINDEMVDTIISVYNGKYKKDREVSYIFEHIEQRYNNYVKTGCAILYGIYKISSLL